MACLRSAQSAISSAAASARRCASAKACHVAARDLQREHALGDTKRHLIVDHRAHRHHLAKTSGDRVTGAGAVY
jgi:hypothetical protein